MTTIFGRASRGSLASRFGARSVLRRAVLSWTGQRYPGYVTYFNADQLFGFAVRDDLPEREYYFHATDIMCESIPRVRPLQSISFTIHEGRNSNQFLARDLAAPDGSSLVFNHSNLRLRAEERTRRLSELPDYETMRHKGIVVALHSDGRGGMIVPDRLNYNIVNYRNHEIQSTGVERLDKLSEIEFFVKRNERRDYAACITREGGQLITAERRETGQIRRALGAMYTPRDLNARIPEDFKQNRKRGYVHFYNSEKLFGWVQPLEPASGDDQNDGLVFVHIDDCHMCGKRSLKRFQEIEYCLVRDDESGKSKAMHVSGPNQTVLRFVSDNHYVPADLCTKQLQTSEDDSVRHHGEIIHAPQGSTYCIVKPVVQGFAPVFAHYGAIDRMGRVAVRTGDAVEFSTRTETVVEGRAESGRLQAVRVTTQAGVPFVFEAGDYGSYLRKRVGLSHSQADLPEAPLGAAPIRGFIASFSPRLRRGMIEVEAPAGERYRKVKFALSDTNVDSSMMPEWPAGVSDEDIAIGVGDSYVTLSSGERVEFGLDECDTLAFEGDLISRRAVSIKGVDGSEVPSRVRVLEDDASRGGGGEHHDEHHSSKTASAVPKMTTATTPKPATKKSDDYFVDDKEVAEKYKDL